MGGFFAGVFARVGPVISTPPGPLFDPCELDATAAIVPGGVPALTVTLTVADVGDRKNGGLRKTMSLLRLIFVSWERFFSCRLSAYVFPGSSFCGVTASPRR